MNDDPNPPAIAHALDALNRSELRALAADLVAWFGRDAVARLHSGAPFASAREQRQLQLTAVDTDAIDVRLAHLRAALAGSLRAAALGHPELLQATSGALRDDISALTRDVRRALAVQLRDGLALVEAIAGTRRYLRDLATSHDIAPPDDGFDLDALLGAVTEALGTPSALDAAGFAELVRVAEALHEVGVDGAWDVVAVAARAAAPAERWLTRALEHRPNDASVLGLLSALAEVPALDPRAFVRAAEMHLDRGAPVYELMARVLTDAGLDDEAQFWRGEALSRPHGQTR